MRKEVRIKSKYEDLKEGLLYVTDDLRLLREMRAAGKAAAAVLTPENRDEDFSGVPYALERPEELEEEDWERLYRRLIRLPWYIAETHRCRIREMTETDLDRLYEIYADAEITRSIEPLFENRDKERRYIGDYRRYVYEFYGYGMWVIEEKTSGQVIGRAGVEAKTIECGAAAKEDGQDGKESGGQADKETDGKGAGEESVSETWEETIELGYMVAALWQRQGIAYEACSAVLDYVRREIGPVSVTARTLPDNLPSIRLLDKLGFQKRKQSGTYLIYEKRV